ncbi:MAG: exopolysaccharide biosynthesis polyprenyl glycosylphosphotransferase [Acidimicrobiia bacterium]|nr:exopolysaccharide biosynthesis polyprenyl glycosylphosphotransferase [Acidimicrobiia bacterium]
MLGRVAPTSPRSPTAPNDRPAVASETPPNGVAAPTEPAPADATRPVVPGSEWLARWLHQPMARLWHRGFRFLFVLDALGLYAAMLAINLVRFGTDWPTYAASHYFVGFAVATGIHLVVNYFSGLYEREPRIGRRPFLPRAVVAVVIGVAVDGLAFVVLDQYLMPRGNLFIFAVVGAVVITANRRFSRVLANRRQGPARVVLVGSPADAERAARHLAISDRDAVLVGRVPSPVGLAAAVEANRATDVLLLDVGSLDAVFPHPMSELEARGVGFMQRVSARDTLLGLQSIREVAGMPFVRLLLHAVPSYKVRLKRLFDLLLLLVSAPITVPVLVVLALYVRLRAGRPMLYRQDRLGREGRPFQVVKFRTMTVDAEQGGIALAVPGDERVIAGLRWLRDTRADELPQLWNVLRGQMSLVGPRPERPELTVDMERDVPGYVRRYELPPGLTGLAQVNGRYSTSAEYKLGYDLQYLVNWSPVLDIQILARTVWVVLSRRV